MEKKSTVVALLLTLFFGPLGLLYATLIGGLVLIGVALLCAVLFWPVGGLLGIPFWLASMIWAGLAVSGHNERAENLSEDGQLRSGSMKKCPHCAELIKTEAKICRYCNREQPEIQAAPPVADGAEQHFDSAACPACGAPLGEGPVCPGCKRWVAA